VTVARPSLPLAPVTQILVMAVLLAGDPWSSYR
jgi:hypothetical protein